MIFIFTIWTLVLLHPSFAEDCSLPTGHPIEGESLGVIDPIADELNHQACHQHENEFRSFLLERANEGLKEWQKTVQCQQEPVEGCDEYISRFNAFFLTVNVYRIARNGFYNNVAQNWYESLSRGQQEVTRSCLIPQNIEGAGVQLGDHVRTIAIQNNISREICYPIVLGYETEVTSRVQHARLNPETVGFSSQQIAKLDDFENSPGVYLLSDQTLGNPHLSEEQLREHILSDFNLSISRIQSFINNINSLSIQDLDQLYVYHDLYLNQFVPNIRENRDVYYPTCFQNRTGECGRLLIWEENRLSDETDLNRCFGTVSNFLLDMIPGRSSIRALGDHQQINPARILNILTQPEGVSLSNQADLQFVLGLPILDAASMGIADNIASASIRNLDGVIIRFSDEPTPTGSILNNLVPVEEVSDIARRQTAGTIDRAKQVLTSDRPQEIPTDSPEGFPEGSPEGEQE